MTSTERKLDEARYFLKQLETSEPYFDYILSAFLNSARSTTWIMRNEFCNKLGWEAWFKECEISEEEKQLLKKTNNLRIASAKQTGIKTELLFWDSVIVDEKYYSTIKEMIKNLEGEEIVITISDEITNEPDSNDNDKEIYKVRGKVRIEEDESEMSRNSIYKLCVNYFNFLEKQVQICVDKFEKI